MWCGVPVSLLHVLWELMFLVLKKIKWSIRHMVSTAIHLNCKKPSIFLLEWICTMYQVRIWFHTYRKKKTLLKLMPSCTEALPVHMVGSKQDRKRKKRTKQAHHLNLCSVLKVSFAGCQNISTAKWWLLYRVLYYYYYYYFRDFVCLISASEFKCYIVYRLLMLSQKPFTMCDQTKVQEA